MLVTAVKPLTKSVLTTASTSFPGCRIPTPIIVMMTAVKILMKAVASQLLGMIKRREETRTNHRQPGHLYQSTRQRQDEREDHTHDTEHDRASAVPRNGVHSDGEGEKMTGHDENQEQHLGHTQHFTTNLTGKHFTCIGHVRDLRVSPLHLTDNITRICRQTTQTNQNDNGAMTESVVSLEYIELPSHTGRDPDQRQRQAERGHRGRRFQLP